MAPTVLASRIKTASQLVVVDQLVPRAKPAGRLAASKGQGGARGHGDR
jgi:hypothetical protein